MELSNGKKVTASFFLLLLTVIIVYSNTIHSSWHFDDYHTIIQNPILHIEDLHPGTLYQTFFANPESGKYSGTKLYRPISCLSFALNWYFGQEKVAGYHVVNLLIHLLTAFFIYLCTVSILDSPQLRNIFRDKKHSIALLSALIWALSPIHTQAITYIVQRMASMSAMFGILSLWLYTAGRNRAVVKDRAYLWVGSAIACLLSVGSKENGVLIPIGMVMIEILFYRDWPHGKVKQLLMWTFGMFFVLGIVGVVYLHSTGALSGYNNRDFTLMQRLMTQPRVLMLYLSQIFWPLPSRFSIEHDIAVSTSLISLWTTLPAIIMVFGMIGIGIMQVRKRPLVSFAILFFFLNHIVESTIIPLEMAFEHRNYLPTAFVFLPIAQGVLWIGNKCLEKNSIISVFFLTAVVTVFVFLGTSTFLRNDVWATEKILWEDAIKKAPGLARPYQNLAYHYYESIGRYDVALILYQKALALRMPTTGRTRTQILTNIGVIYDKAGEYEVAYGYYIQALEISPKELKPRYNAAMALIGMGRFEDALKMTDYLILRKPRDKDCNNLRGSILLKMGRPDEAVPYLRKSLDSDTSYYKALINLGIALYQIDEFDTSKNILEAALTQVPGQGLPLFCLIENRLRAKDTGGADAYLQKLLGSVTLDEIDMVLKSIGKNNFLVPLSFEIIAPFIEEKTGGVPSTSTKGDSLS